MAKQALHTFDVKEKKLQLITVVLLVILLPLLLYLLQKALQIGTFGAPDAELSIITPGGRTQYAVGEEMIVDVVLNSGSNQVEAVEATIEYDPTVVSLKAATGFSTDANVNCSQVTPLKNDWVKIIDGLSVDTGTGAEIGTETGSVTFVCSAVPPTDQWVNGVAVYQPTTVNFNETIATLRFTTLQETANATLAFEFTPADPKNDSSVLLYEGGCCSTTEVLNAVNNYTYTVGTGGVGGPVPTTPPSTPPSTTTTNLSLATQTGATQFSVGQEMAVDVVLNSAANQVEAVEATIFYDPSVVSLKATTGFSTDANVTCTQSTALKNDWVKIIDGLSVDTATGAEIGTETGSVTFVCSAVPPTDQWVNGVAVYQPAPAGFNGTIATLNFTTLTDATNATLTYEFTPADPKNDSSVLVYEGGCCSTTEVLEEVYNLTYTVGTGGPIAPTPTTPPVGGVPTPTTPPVVGGPTPTPLPQDGEFTCSAIGKTLISSDQKDVSPAKHRPSHTYSFDRPADANFVIVNGYWKWKGDSVTEDQPNETSDVVTSLGTISCRDFGNGEQGETLHFCGNVSGAFTSNDLDLEVKFTGGTRGAGSHWSSVKVEWCEGVGIGGPGVPTATPLPGQPTTPPGQPTPTTIATGPTATPLPPLPTYTPVPTSIVCDQCGFCVGEEVPAEYGECVQCLYGDAADPNNPEGNLDLVPIEGNAWTIAGCVETNVGDATGSLAEIANAIVAAIGILSALIGGFLTTISGGDATKLEQGKKLLVAGISAIVLSIFAGFAMQGLGGDLLRIPGIGS